MRIAIVGVGVSGAYLLNRIPPEHTVEAFEMKEERNWYTVCAWGTSEPYISDLVRMAGFNFGDYVLHRGKEMTVDLGDDELKIKLKGLVTYDKHRLTHDMLKGKKVHWGQQIKKANGNFDGFDMVVDATGLHRSLLPKIQEDMVIPSLEYQVKSDEVPYHDFVIRPYPGLCVTPETLVMSNPGTKPIGEIAAGETVLTKSGWTKVQRVYHRKFTGDVFDIVPYLFNFPVGLTPEHLVWVMDKATGKIGWKPAKAVRECHSKASGDYVCIPIPTSEPLDRIQVSDFVEGVVKGTKIYLKGRNQFGSEFGYRQPIPNNLLLSDELCEFFGYYVSEGNAFSTGIILSNYDPKVFARMKELGERLFGIEGKLYVPHQVQFNSTVLRRLFVSLFGEGAHNKRLPRSFLGLSASSKISLIRALFIGDGSKESGRYDYLSYTTTSRELAVGLWQILLSVGVVGSVAWSDVSESYRVRAWGRQLERLGDIFGALNLTRAERPPRKWVIKDGMLYFAVRKVTKRSVADQPVYDLETNGSFTTSFLVHNSGYWWWFPLGDGTGHVGAGDLKGRYRYELDEFVKKYHCEVLRRIGRPVRVTPPKYCEPFFDGKVVGVGESVGTVYPMLGEGIIPSMQCVNLFVEHLGDPEGYRKAVLDHFAIYAKVYKFIKAKVEDRFSLLTMWPTLLSVYWYMRNNEQRYGLETRLSEFFKIVTRL